MHGRKLRPACVRTRSNGRLELSRGGTIANQIAGVEAKAKENEIRGHYSQGGSGGLNRDDSSACGPNRPKSAAQFETVASGQGENVVHIVSPYSQRCHATLDLSRRQQPPCLGPPIIAVGRKPKPSPNVCVPSLKRRDRKHIRMPVGKGVLEHDVPSHRQQAPECRRSQTDTGGYFPAGRITISNN